VDLNEPISRAHSPRSFPPGLSDVPDLARAALHVYAVPMTERFRGLTVREGIVIEGPRGWGEFCPFEEYDDESCAAWLAAALEAAWLGWPPAVRDVVDVNAIVPAVSPERAFDLVASSGCRTAKVKVADGPRSLGLDADRVAAVRDALGPGGQVRVDANGRWDVDTAVMSLGVLDDAAAGLQYAEQPCQTVEELAEVRRRTHVPIAADESIRRAEDPLAVARAHAADVAVVKCSPLGGVRRSLAVAEQLSGSDDEVRPLSIVVSSALETSIGLAAELALAGALPRLELACGLGTLSLLAADVVREPAPLVDGALRVPSGPPVPDGDALAACLQRDRARELWWRERLTRAHAALRQMLGAAHGSSPPR
jgi:o-succinylbenzoate synthase